MAIPICGVAGGPPSRYIPYQAGRRMGGRLWIEIGRDRWSDANITCRGLNRPYQKLLGGLMRGSGW